MAVVCGDCRALGRRRGHDRASLVGCRVGCVDGRRYHPSGPYLIVTEQLAWPLALWIAATVGPLTYLQSRDGGCTTSNPNN